LLYGLACWSLGSRRSATAEVNGFIFFTLFQRKNSFLAFKTYSILIYAPGVKTGRCFFAQSALLWNFLIQESVALLNNVSPLSYSLLSLSIHL
jgi:hypothetical protein